MRKLLAGLVLLFWGASAVAVNITPTATGDNTSLTLTVGVSFSSTTPSPFGTCPAGNFFVAANVPNIGWHFLVEGVGWQFWSGIGRMPAYSLGPLCPRSIEIASGMNVSSLIGTQVYVGIGYSGGADNSGYGYGAEASDMLANGTYAMVYTIPGVVNGVMRYSDKVYATWTGAYPYAVTRTGVVRVVNRTRIAGAFAYMNCLLASVPLPDGRILVDAQEGIPPFGRHILYINPLEDAMYDYVGTVPADIVWRGVQPFDPLTPTWGAKARVSGGWYFTTGTNTWTLLFQEDGSPSPIVVKAGVPAVDEIIHFMASYSN